MTYREFGERYLTPPERVRYFHNILELNYNINVKNIDEQKPSGKCFFCDIFLFCETIEGINYWNNLERKILKTFDTAM